MLTNKRRLELITGKNWNILEMERIIETVQDAAKQDRWIRQLNRTNGLKESVLERLFYSPTGQLQKVSDLAYEFGILPNHMQSITSNLHADIVPMGKYVFRMPEEKTPLTLPDELEIPNATQLMDVLKYSNKQFQKYQSKQLGSQEALDKKIKERFLGTTSWQVYSRIKSRLENWGVSRLTFSYDRSWFNRLGKEYDMREEIFAMNLKRDNLEFPGSYHNAYCNFVFIKKNELDAAIINAIEAPKLTFNGEIVGFYNPEKVDQEINQNCTYNGIRQIRNRF